MNTAGIDVSAKTVTLVISREGRTGKLREFKNMPQGHAALIKVLHKAQVERVYLEATGLYHLDLALALDDAGLAVMVVNPKAAKRFAEAMQTRTKTDAVDAKLLAEFAQRMPFVPWLRPETWPWPSAPVRVASPLWANNTHRPKISFMRHSKPP